jgi:predicted TPR repeat methyltransferase
MEQGVQVPESTIDLFRRYCHIEKEQEIRDRILKAQQLGMGIYDYKCIKEMRFATPRCVLHHRYNSIIESIGDGTVLDIGCCMGTDVRRMIVDGVPREHIWGVDLRSDFFEVGFLMFNDRDTMKDHFIAADLLVKDTSSWSERLKEGFNIVYCGSVFHLLDEEQICLLANNIYNVLLKPGGIFFGRTMGSASDASLRFEYGNQLKFLHSKKTMKSMLESVGFINVSIEYDSSEAALSSFRHQFLEKASMMHFYAEKPL